MKEGKPLICCICDKEIEEELGWSGGHDPWPLLNSGRCCRLCNMGRVLPARAERYKRYVPTHLS